MRKQFTFYSSFWEAVKELPEKEGNAVLRAICAYALEEDERELSSMGRIVFSLIKPTLDTAAKKAASGRVGGEANRKQNESKSEANRKQNESKSEANRKQNESKSEANRKQNESKKEGEGEKEKEVEKEVEIENESYKKEMQKKKDFVPPTREEVRAYARERNSAVNPDTFFDYFQAGDWTDSRGMQVRAWKQKFVTWEKMQAERSMPLNPVRRAELSFADIYREELEKEGGAV